ncbi:MAG: bifunctional UDP-N-acetylglucosamine diphosphorylase/glucosamine-1-phosphate N-acetyltransferase GlmU, partial [Gammaproteobacteria bacterium]|nr:bifunctional UDP-N-acetylglucosamine diphosphorylase/glucosamine-1-phosphate N-acetyltransferase GlmU [Gammaproteobacteria bacterium]
LERVVNAAQKLNPANIYVIHGNGGDTIKKTLSHLKLEWVEQKQQLGTAHAVMQALPYVDDNSRILILYGDVPLISDKLLKQLIDSTPQNEFGLITAKLANPFGFGRIIRDTYHKIIANVEQKDATPDQEQIQEINSGIMLGPAKEFKRYLPQIKTNNQQGEYYLTDIIATAVADHHTINGLIAPKPEEILGINDKSQLAALERYYQRQQAEKLMQQGLTIMDPARFDLRGSLEFGKDVVIDINVLVKGKVKLGNNVKIQANSIIEDTVIEDNCSIGPFARTRPGTYIKANAEIGNFVELKNTTFGENSKANHLTYLGDTTVGKNVNIGAGSITCNYDGVNKHPTAIGDNAFIGSNTMMVAPVKIGKNATTAAGSVITKDAPDDELTIARAHQASIKGWQRPTKKS